MIFRRITSIFVIAIYLLTIVVAKKPNIVFILADDYGWNDIGYRNQKIYTPELDRLAASGVKLDNYYVQPICTPSRSQLLSGRYQIHTGLQHALIWAQQPNGLPLELPTIADVVKKAGYSTHMVGKWHLGFYKQAYTPLRRGFDSYYGYLTGSEDYFNHMRCITVPGTTPSRSCGLDLRDNLNPDWNQKGNYSAHIFTERAKQVIINHTKMEKDKPLFLYLPYQSVHSPLEVPKRYLQKYKHVNNTNRRNYLGMVTCMDEAIANITQQLKTSGLWEDTVLVFSTDNGGQILSGGNNWPLRGWKGSLWEGGIKGVGFVTAGNNIKLENRGTIISDLIHVSDWFPTIAYLAEADIRDIKLDGYNIWNTISHGNPAVRKEILHNIDPMYKLKGTPRVNSSFPTNVRSAIRVGKWKLITGDPGDSRWIPEPTTSDDNYEFSKYLNNSFANTFLEFEIDKLRIESDKSTKNLWLFDIELDPNEEEDLSSMYPEVVDHMLNRLSFYNSTAVPVNYPKFDEKGCDPRKFNGVWSPWRD